MQHSGQRPEVMPVAAVPIVVICVPIAFQGDEHRLESAAE